MRSRQASGTSMFRKLGRAGLVRFISFFLKNACIYLRYLSS